MEVADKYYFKVQPDVEVDLIESSTREVTTFYSGHQNYHLMNSTSDTLLGILAADNVLKSKDLDRQIRFLSGSVVKEGFPDSWSSTEMIIEDILEYKEYIVDYPSNPDLQSREAINLHEYNVKIVDDSANLLIRIAFDTIDFFRGFVSILRLFNLDPTDYIREIRDRKGILQKMRIF